MSSFGLRLSGGAGAQEAGGRAECVRSGLLLLLRLRLLARHLRSGVCCAAVGRAKEEREEGELGVEGGSGWALRRGEQRQHAGLCHFTTPRCARTDTRGEKARWRRTRSDNPGGPRNHSKPSLSLKVILFKNNF